MRQPCLTSNIDYLKGIILCKLLIDVLMINWPLFCVLLCNCCRVRFILKEVLVNLLKQAVPPPRINHPTHATSYKTVALRSTGQCEKVVMEDVPIGFPSDGPAPLLSCLPVQLDLCCTLTRSVFSVCPDRLRMNVNIW